MKKELVSRNSIVIGLLVMGIVTRLLPHWPNFTAVGAVALVGGALLRPKALAAVITVAILLISDFVLGFYSGMWLVYGSFLLIAMMGQRINISNPLSIGGYSIGGSLVFYLITNFGSWYGSPFYSQDFMGLINSYIAGLPFALNFTLATLFFSAFLFGTYYMLSKQYSFLDVAESPE
jgi:hypothetical protein